MNSRSLLRLVTLAAVLGLCVGIVGSASADNNYWFGKRATVTVPTGLNPDDLHVLFTGAGGTIVKPILISPAGSASVDGSGNRIDITLNNKASAGNQVVFTFTNNFAAVGLDSAYWTNGGNWIGSVAPSEFSMAAMVPGVSTSLLIVLAVLMLGLGAFAIRRRRELA